MTIAFCLYKYFPFGGLQRDFMRIAQAVTKRGHRVRVYVLEWQGERPVEFEVVIVPVKSPTNHGRNSKYYQWVQAHLKAHPADRVVGFNKMPGLDIYYAADVCYAEKVAREKGFFYKLTRRYRHYAAFEYATFHRGAKTQLLMLTERQINDFRKHYKTEENRFHMLPPGISLDRKYSHQIPDSRAVYRARNHIPHDHYLLLQIGSDFRRKGVDRTLQAVASLPEAVKEKTTLMIVGQDKAEKYQTLATQLGIADRVQFFRGRDDIAELMAAADLLLHPAYQEAAGIVLLEGIVAGLPVLVTEVCGYAHHISDAECGVVLKQPFEQRAFNDAVRKGLENISIRNQWATNARHYADTQDLYSLPEKAADLILGSKHD
ncbi:glucosyltransferase I RfaG [[Pantoea] beijingensis]|uniref:Glucosyltransferase I RfaG n=1 Tax=[Pantoea] beijingensis TaxID=1324864 RepID=A0A443IGR3_9GAMM|nr:MULTISPECIES: glycosyltransferase family 4 protein [Erwiniaceae]RWR03190.1 glucosyltransferase I RfaG [[Pantoea] beijingensis]